MIKIVKFNGAPSASPYRYSLAGHDMLFQERVHSLEAFLVEPDGGFEWPEVAQQTILNQANSHCVYQGRAPFEHRIQDVCFWQQNHVSQVDVAGTPVCQIDSERELITVLNDLPFDTQLNLEVLTGPACILLMAKRRTFCLHASAVATPAGNVLFVAESGSGKSTLSKYQGDGWNQLSDDISPLQIGSRVQLHTRFPQLKLENASVKNRLADELSVDLIIRIGNKACKQIEFIKLDSTQAFLQIVRHTVAAKLFNPTQLNAHAEFAQKVVKAVPVVEINYPRDLKQLPTLRQSIVDYLTKRS